MAGALTEVLPLGLAVAVSPFAIIPVILLLFTPRALVTSAAFLGGWVLGLAGAAVAFAFLASVIELAEETPTWAAWGRIVARRGVARPRCPPVAGPPQAQVRARLDDQAPRQPRQARPSASLSCWPSPTPRSCCCRPRRASWWGRPNSRGPMRRSPFCGFTLVASLSVAVPVVLYAVLGERILVPLGRARDWLERNNAAVMAIVILVIGVSLVVKGGQGL